MQFILSTIVSLWVFCNYSEIPCLVVKQIVS
jgi:hypothetical protein